jgi:tRNA(Ser,Leu) C12 N-acetylase TAN1
VTERSVPAIPTWNVLVTSLEGQRESLLRALRTLARFRRGGFPNVLVATVESPHAFLGALRDLHASSQLVRESLGRCVPIDRTMRFADPATFADEVVATLDPLVERLVGKTFFVRLFRRGFRTSLDSTRLEGEIGARLVDALTSRGDTPHVRFKDADVAVAIETLRDEAGVALVDRALREAYPFVRIR